MLGWQAAVHHAQAHERSCTAEWVDGWNDGRVVGWSDAWMDGWIADYATAGPYWRNYLGQPSSHHQKYGNSEVPPNNLWCRRDAAHPDPHRLRGSMAEERSGSDVSLATLTPCSLNKLLQLGSGVMIPLAECKLVRTQQHVVACGFYGRRLCRNPRQHVGLPLHCSVAPRFLSRDQVALATALAKAAAEMGLPASGPQVMAEALAQLTNEKTQFP
eukprot:359108-Chlamydomonas_euryale.AAC.14